MDEASTLLDCSIVANRRFVGDPCAYRVEVASPLQLQPLPPWACAAEVRRIA